jgi:hypothetical protein
LNAYLDTLRESVDLDLLIVCNADGEAVGASTIPENSGLCAVDGGSRFLPPTPEHASLMFATGGVQNISLPSYRVFLGKNSSSVLTQFQEETGLLYLLLRDNQVVESSDPPPPHGPGTVGEVESENRLGASAVSIVMIAIALSLLLVANYLRLRSKKDSE